MKLLLIQIDDTMITGLKINVARTRITKLHIDEAKDVEDAISILRTGVYYDCILATTRSAVNLPFEMRKWKFYVPIIMICRRDDPRFNAEVLNKGADDILVMPVSSEELTARIEAVVRRHENRSFNVIEIGKLRVDLDNNSTYYSNKFVHLTRKQFQVLSILARRKGVVLSREFFIEYIYNGVDEPELKVIDVFVCKIRKAFLEMGEPSIIKTVFGVGFTLGEIDEINGKVLRPDDMPEVVKEDEISTS